MQPHKIEPIENSDSVIHIWEDRFPEIEELVQYGGRPGWSYAMATPIDIPEMIRGGYKQLIPEDGSTFIITGPDGESNVFLFYTGEDITGASPDSFKCELLFHNRIGEETGLGKYMEEFVEPETPTQKSVAEEVVVVEGSDTAISITLPIAPKPLAKPNPNASPPPQK